MVPLKNMTAILQGYYGFWDHYTGYVFLLALTTRVLSAGLTAHLALGNGPRFI